LPDGVLVVRFKDDYRILAKTAESGRLVIKQLQAACREFRLELHDEKTVFHALPDGLFRKWVSQYHAANPRPKSPYNFKRFKEVCLSVVAIDRANPGCGVIDRFLADIAGANGRLRVRLNRRSLPRVISLLMMVANLRTKAFPKSLAIIEAILETTVGHARRAAIASHLAEFLDGLSGQPVENSYLMVWIVYFMRANGLEGALRQKKCTFGDPIVRAAYTSRFAEFRPCKGFKVFRGVKQAAKTVSLLRHLDVFGRS
jgi:hypothetical protein